MHILVIPSWYATADNPVLGSFFREQARALTRAGHRVGMAAPRLRSVREAPTGLLGAMRGIEVVDDEGIATYRLEDVQLLPGLKAANDARWVRAGRRLVERYLADQGAPDVLHAHGVFFGGVIGAAAKRDAGVPLVITEHSTVYARRAFPAFQLEEARDALAEADARVVVSPQLGELMERVVGPQAAPWEWVPNTVDARFLAAERPRRTPGRPFTFLTVGFLYEKKDVAGLLRAFAAAFGGDAGVRLRIGGEGPESKRLEALSQELGIADKVAFLGKLGREEVLAEMLAADAFVLPSRIETFGVVVIEALATGLPVVATRSGGPECIITEADGLLVPPSDVEALSQALVAMRASVSRYDASDLKRRCAERFGEGAFVSAIERVYARVTTGGGA